MPEAYKSVASLVISSRFLNEEIVRFYQHKLRNRYPVRAIWLDRDAITVLDGHHRYEAYRREGVNLIWCRWFNVATPFKPHVHKDD